MYYCPYTWVKTFMLCNACEPIKKSRFIDYCKSNFNKRCLKNFILIWIKWTVAISYNKYYTLKSSQAFLDINRWRSPSNKSERLQLRHRKIQVYWSVSKEQKKSQKRVQLKTSPETHLKPSGQYYSRRPSIFTTPQR